MPTIIPQPIPEVIPKMNYTGLRQAFQNIGGKITKRAIQSDNYSPGVSGLKIDFEAGTGEFQVLSSGAFIKVFIQASIPTSLNVNDIWMDSDDNNKRYYAASVGADQIAAGEWVAVPEGKEWADILDGASTKPENNADVTGDHESDISLVNLGEKSFASLTAGTITSKAITLAVSAGAGDVKIQAGKTDFGDNTAGFILGIDDSDSDKAKFEIGDSSNSLKWNGSALNIIGTITATTGEIGGFTIGATTIYSSGNEIVLDSANKKITVGTTNKIFIDGDNKRIQSDNYVSGYAGAGFHLSDNLLEVGNIACRGLIRTSVFQKDVISTVGGNLMVLDGDVLDVDMTGSGRTSDHPN